MKLLSDGIEIIVS